MQNNEILFKSLFKLQQMLPPYLFSQTGGIVQEFLNEAEKYQNTRGVTQGSLSKNEEFLAVISRVIDAHQKPDRYKVAALVAARWRYFSEDLGVLAREKLMEYAPHANAEDWYDAQTKIYNEFYRRTFGKERAGKKLLGDILENIRNDISDEKRYQAAMKFVRYIENDDGAEKAREGAMKIAAESIDALPPASRHDSAKEWLVTSFQDKKKDQMTSIQKSVWKKSVAAIDSLPPAEQYDACIRLYEIGNQNKSSLEIPLSPLVDKAIAVIDNLPDSQKYDAATHIGRLAITEKQEEKATLMMVRFLEHTPKEIWYRESGKIIPMVEKEPRALKRVVEIAFEGLKHGMEAGSFEKQDEFLGLRTIFKQATACHLPRVVDEAFILIERQMDDRPLSRRFGDAVWMLKNTEPDSGQNKRAFTRVVDAIGTIPEKDTHEYKEAVALADAQTDPDRKMALETAIAKRQPDFGLGLGQFLGMIPVVY